LLGGETAEMPGVYAEGEVDVVGTIVGVVDREKIIDGTRIEAGDVVLGLGSASPHTNGYSLIRHVLGDMRLDVHDEDLGDVPLDALLRPHRSYYGVVQSMLDAGIDIRGMVHITGGGFVENPPRIMADELSMHIDRNSWSVPRLYRWLQDKGGIPEAEMYRVFNMGVGLLVVISKDQLSEAQSAALSAVPAGEDWIVQHVGDIRPREDAPVTFTPELTD
jgi:phosphoribosylformylglycinamidine cyclo-ligase